MKTFMGVDAPQNTLEKARVAFLPVPYDATATFQSGARNAPEAIITSSYHIEEWDEELGRDIGAVGIYTAPPVEPLPGDPAVMVDQIEARCSELLERGKFVVTVGGDHTVAVGAFRAHAARYGRLSVLHVDAHADLRDAYEGTPYSHACALRRMASEADLVQVGIRAISEPEVAWLKETGRRPPFYAHELAQRDPADWIEQVVAELGPQVYVTFDVDGLDPSFMAATGTPEPGGLGWWPTLRLLRRVGEEREVVGADVCELLPTPGLHACDVTVARLVYKMIGYFVKG